MFKAVQRYKAIAVLHARKRNLSCAVQRGGRWEVVVDVGHCGDI
jgi:hypothetical protein